MADKWQNRLRRVRVQTGDLNMLEKFRRLTAVAGNPRVFDRCVKHMTVEGDNYTLDENVTTAVMDQFSDDQLRAFEAGAALWSTDAREKAPRHKWLACHFLDMAAKRS